MIFRFRPVKRLEMPTLPINAPPSIFSLAHTP
jgi:hypothetical protein